MKKILSLLSALLLLSLFSAAAVAYETGTCGANMNWVLDDSYTMTISGKGAMTYVPWRLDDSMKNSIKRIVIEEGVTSIPDWAFNRCENLTYALILDGVTSIGEWAFSARESRFPPASLELTKKRFAFARA